jgi:hypothetical protein
MDVSDLVIEVTRRCNMQCPHCLRGEAQNLDIDRQYVDQIFSKISRIYTLTITGGEPSLAPDKIEMVTESAKQHEVSIGSFYCATNAKQVPDRFIMAILQLYLYCEETEDSWLTYSSDPFHAPVSPRMIKRLEAFRFVEPKHGAQKPEQLLMEGRAYNNYGGGRYLEPQSFRVDNESIDDNELYLNCKGNLVAGCDCSYETQDESNFLIGNVMEIGDLQKAIEQYNRKISPELICV